MEAKLLIDRRGRPAQIIHSFLLNIRLSVNNVCEKKSNIYKLQYMKQFSGHIRQHINGAKRQVYIKFRDNGRMQDLLQSTGRQVEYRHTSGEISTVREVSTAGKGTSGVPICNTHRRSVVVPRTVLSRYREVMDIQGETWSRLFL